eukprot:TRINITY_DN61115_c0_g1_i1.p1 TRINITY_DN61115_c0_g1~~TRINITY_DN61115_c0_g1_i1.p1  ORF type:complete len:364 (+),score=54.02 TRINITY_DN61115_c0_g1_i1:32-1123(+)
MVRLAICLAGVAGVGLVVCLLMARRPGQMSRADRPISSTGCSGGAASLSTGKHSLFVTDPLLGRVERSFELIAPTAASQSSTPMPLLLGFHGQGHSSEDWGPRERFTELAKQHQWVAVFPNALSETTDKGNNDTTWNCGAAGDSSTCLDNTAGVQCTVSCQKLQRCSRCNWATCYDDVAFIQALLAELERSFCLDSQSYFLVGESNGGMFVHYLIQELPGKFLAAAPVFASPLMGYLVGSQYQLLSQKGLAGRTSMIQLHDRSDTTIPWQGGRSQDGWLYESLDRSVGVWAALHGCSLKAQRAPSTFDGGPANLQCLEHGNCTSQGRVMFCIYDGNHGDWPDQPRADDLIWSFFESRMRVVSI